MIIEDYVSFETAKLLKEKGFDEECRTFWKEWNGQIILCHCSSNHVFEWCHNSMLDGYNDDSELNVAAPTLQMAMKWLREVHNLVIEPYRTACGYLYTISNTPYGSTKYDNSQAFNGDNEDSGQWSTWEKACEDGIKYCLENLI